MQKKPNRTDNKRCGFWINEGLNDEINSRLSSDKLDKKNLLTTAVRAYIHGEATTVTKDGREIYFKCEIK